MTQTMIHPDYARFCRGELDDPFPLFDHLREHDPVHWSDAMRMWLVTCYDDVHWGLRENKRLSSSRKGLYSDHLDDENRRRTAPLRRHLDKWMLNLDGPEHTRFRKLVNLAFTPRTIERLLPGIEQTIDRMAGELREAGQFDFVERFCFPLPAWIICRMLGMPDDKAHMLHEHSRALADFSGAAGPSLNNQVDRAMRGYEALITYFDGLIDQRRQDPGDDLVSAMLSAEDEGDRLTRDELFAMCVFLYIAGHSTTAGVLANGAYLLMRHPNQFKKLRSNPDRFAASAVEEILRYESPVPRGVRQAVETIDLRGQRIQAGQTVTFLIGAANRDPAQFDDPQVFDIERSPNKHLAFGFGKHFCLGAQLARLEAAAAFKSIARRMPNLRSIGEPTWVTRHGLRSPASLPVEVGV